MNYKDELATAENLIDYVVPGDAEYPTPTTVVEFWADAILTKPATKKLRSFRSSPLKYMAARLSTVTVEEILNDVAKTQAVTKETLVRYAFAGYCIERAVRGMNVLVNAPQTYVRTEMLLFKDSLARRMHNLSEGLE